MLIVLAATTEYRTHHALLFWSFAASVVITIGTRVGLKACGERVHALPPGRLDLFLAVAVGVPLIGDRERFLSAGMDAYLAKPFSAPELYSVLRHVVSTYRPD